MIVQCCHLTDDVDNNNNNNKNNNEFSVHSGIL